jgi:hypothetical protein
MCGCARGTLLRRFVSDLGSGSGWVAVEVKKCQNAVILSPNSVDNGLFLSEIRGGKNGK